MNREFSNEFSTQIYMVLKHERIHFAYNLCVSRDRDILSFCILSAHVYAKSTIII